MCQLLLLILHNFVLANALSFLQASIIPYREKSKCSSFTMDGEDNRDKHAAKEISEVEMPMILRLHRWR
jgi:hypothetical protein